MATSAQTAACTHLSRAISARTITVPSRINPCGRHGWLEMTSLGDLHKPKSFILKNPKSPGDVIAQSRRKALSYAKASNFYNLRDQYRHTDLVTNFIRFEQTDMVEHLDPREARRGQWVLIYVVLQVLATISVDSPNLRLEGYITFYPGETMTLTLANGTTLGPEPFDASYNGPENTGPLVTGGDFYNFFVLGFYPASYDPYAFQTSEPTPSATGEPSSTETTETDIPTPTSLDHPAYPTKPNIYQPDIGSTGILTGYFLRDISTAVLSIPSFQAFDFVQTFSDTVGKFLAKSKEAGMKKILIDLQENGGGDTFLAIDTFKQFFPSIEPFAGSRLRAHEWADVLGTTFTEFFDTQRLNESFYNALIVTNWVSTYRINAETGQSFTSWKQLFGPHFYNGDFFTTPQQYNLSSPVVNLATSGGILVHGFNGVPTPPQPYNAEDIVILTDGLCSSTCALFMELMHHQAGVRTLVAGGRPITGPMQAPAGSRGAQLYSVGDLDADIQVASRINATARDILPSRELDVFVSQLTINLRDQIRQGEYIPLQFLYEAADCRIFEEGTHYHLSPQMKGIVPWRDRSGASKAEAEHSPSHSWLVPATWSFSVLKPTRGGYKPILWGQFGDGRIRAEVSDLASISSPKAVSTTPSKSAADRRHGISNSRKRAEEWVQSNGVPSNGEVSDGDLTGSDADQHGGGGSDAEALSDCSGDYFNNSTMKAQRRRALIYGFTDFEPAKKW